MAKATHKIVATIGTYKDKQTGEEKKRYLQVGVAFTDDQGRISLKIDAMPVAPTWSGFLSLYPLDDDRPPQREAPPSRTVPQRPAARPSQQPARQEPPDGPISDGMEEDDIPF